MGAADGAPVLGFHGTSLSRLAHVGDDAPRAAGVRLILVDRPGYGLSDLHPGRTLLDWPRDIAELADGLGIDRFAVFGMSGGGPHAASCAYALPDRVSALGLVSSPAPVWDRPELRFSAPPHRRPMIELAERDPISLPASCSTTAAPSSSGWPPTRATAQGGGPAADQAILADPEVRGRFEAATRETVARGPEGYAHDLFLLYVAPWGFRPEEIAVPTQIWHGDEDAAVSPRIAEFFAETIPGSRLHMLPAPATSCSGRMRRRSSARSLPEPARNGLCVPSGTGGSHRARLGRAPRSGARLDRVAESRETFGEMQAPDRAAPRDRGGLAEGLRDPAREARPVRWRGETHEFPTERIVHEPFDLRYRRGTR